MALICSTKFSTSTFHWDPKDRTFSVDISTLADGGATQVFSRLFDDACDEGFVLRSERTGREITFVVNTEHKDGEQDVTHWSLVPVDEFGWPGQPGVEPYYVVVFND